MPEEPVPKTAQAAGAGYLCFWSPAGESGAGEGDEEPEAWAAMLVVNARALPQEFLYSGPLRPTPVQAILYQDRLESEIRLSLVRSLLRGLRSHLSFVAIGCDELDLDFSRELPCPVL